MPNLLLECAVRAALIAAVTAAVLLALRVKGAAARHAAWLGVVVWMLLLPAWTAWVPQAPLRVLPAPKPIEVRSVQVSAPVDMRLPDLPVPPRRTWNWTEVFFAAYALGAAILLARLAIGGARAHALMRTAYRQEGHWTSASCVAPVTVGWLHPRVILPQGWREWPAAQIAAVLAHENEHARRRDPLMQLLALVNRAAFWFHPLAWWLERRLSALAEEACDVAALAGGHDPYDYSHYLLDIARAVERTGARVNVLGMAMPGSALPRRIRQILSASPVQRTSRARSICAVAACLLFSSVFAAGALVREKARVIAVHPVMAAIVEAPAPAASPIPPVPAPQQAQSGRFIVLYFPLSQLDNEEQLRAVSAARKFVSNQLRAADRVAIMTFDAATMVVQDFTSDHDVLLQALDRVPNGSSTAQQVPDRLAEGLQTAINMLGQLKEKKALMFFARTMPEGTLNLRPLIDSAIHANIALYPITVGGLR